MEKDSLMNPRDKFKVVAFLQLALWLAIPASLCCAESGPKVFKSEKDGFAITLPNDWTEVSAGEVKAFSERASSSVNTPQRQTYEYAYQHISEHTGLEFPYILVQVANTGAVPEEEVIRQTSQMEIIAKKIIEDTKKNGSILTEAEANHATYDRERRVMRILSHVDVPGFGKIDGISALFLTSRGALTFHCYNRKADFDSTREVFESMLASVKLADNLVYQPPPTRSSFFSNVIGYGVIGACVGLVVGLLKWLFVGKKPKIPRDIN
jgi:hypothetical protein